MRFVVLLALLAASCSGGCGPKPVKQMSSSDCVTWKCSSEGECTCADK